MARRTLADVTGTKAPSNSVLMAPWPYLLAGVIVLAVAAWSMFGGTAESARAQDARGQARQVANQFTQVAQEIQEMLRNDAVQAAAAAVQAGEARVAGLLAEMRQLIPEVTDVHVYPPEVFMTPLEDMGENSFIMLDMMASALEDEVSPVQLIEDGGLSYVAGASTIGRAVQDRGFILVYLDPTYVLNLFSVSDPAVGYIALEHATGSNAPKKLREVGGMPAGYTAERLPIEGSLLQVVYPTTRGEGIIGAQERVILLIVGILLLAIGVVRQVQLRQARPMHEAMPERFATMREGELPPETIPPTLRETRGTGAGPARKTRAPGDTAAPPARLGSGGQGTGGEGDPASARTADKRPGPGRGASKQGAGERPTVPPSFSDTSPFVGRISDPGPDTEVELPPSLRPQPTSPEEPAKPSPIAESDSDTATGDSASEPEKAGAAPAEAGSGSPFTEEAQQRPVPSALMPQADPPASPPPEGVALDSHIFRAYDIRGVVGESLDPGIAYQIGRAIGSQAQDSLATPVVVGRDGRHSGPELAQGLMAGIRDSGADVIDIGAVPTGVLYYAANELSDGTGVMVTGSHNPPDYNGFKIMIGGRTLAGDEIFGLYERIRSDSLHSGQGEVTGREMLDAYRDRIAGDITLARPLKVVADCGNGIGGVCAAEVLRAIGAEVVPLFEEVDGDFPNHHPDPSEPENLEQLIETVRLTGADLGLAFDGDADRLGVVTPDGEIVFSDRIMMLYAREVLGRNPGATIIYDVKCTGHLDTVIREAGGKPEMYKTGHSLMKNRMKEAGAPLAGEMSGHFFFQDRWYGFDCGIYSACRLLEILADAADSPAEVLGALPNSVSTPELKVHLAEGENHEFIETFKQRAKFPGARISIIDGVRADFADGWGLVRASNTTPILVLRFDADSEQALRNVQEAFRAQLLAVRSDLELPF